MPIWASIAIGIGVFAVLAGASVAGYFAWRAYTKRLLLGLVGSTEAVESSAQALVELMSRLAAAGDEELEEFATDPESSERRALHEVASRARILTDEVDVQALPRPLIQLAESIGDAAYLIASQASRVTDDDIGSSALENLSSVDLASVRAYTKQARYRLAESCRHYGLVDTAVYGGGLYL